jgi:hypothetical protein
MNSNNQENDSVESSEVLCQEVLSQADFINLMAQYKRAVYEQFWPSIEQFTAPQ